jgi:hypothetical protein
MGLLFAGVSCLGGCGLANVTAVYDAARTSPGAKTEAASVSPGCSLWMQLRNRNREGETRMISEKVCVLATDGPVAVPRDFKLWLSDEGTWDHYGLCLGEAESARVGGKELGVAVCRWNGVFRDSYPWTFVFTGPNVAEAAQAVRVFRNGELVWTWVPRPGARLEELVIEGKDLLGHLIPQNAPIDVRILPAGVTVDQSVLAAKVEKRPSQWQVQFGIAKEALLSSPSVAGGLLREKVDCLRHRVELVNHYAGQIAGATAEKPPAPARCEADVLAPAPDSLLGEYRKLKGKAASDVDAAEQELKQSIATYRDRLGKKEREQLAKFEEQARLFWEGKGTWWPTGSHTDAERAAYLKDMEDPAVLRSVVAGSVPSIWTTRAPTEAELWWLRTRGTPAELALVLRQADTLVSQGIQAVDDTLALASELRKDAVRIASSPDEQARLFLRTAQSLQSSSIFDGRVDNPEPLPGERALTMKYSDHWQWFSIAPWNAFPVSLKGKAEFDGANLIPIVDVLGLRYQFSGSRLGDMRVGIGATVLAFTVRKEQAAAGGGTEIVDHEQLRIVPEANVGFANVKLGVARAFRPPNAWRDHEEWRLLVGADLYKLVSGKNVEAF